MCRSCNQLNSQGWPQEHVQFNHQNPRQCKIFQKHSFTQASLPGCDQVLAHVQANSPIDRCPNTLELYLSDAQMCLIIQESVRYLRASPTRVVNPGCKPRLPPQFPKRLPTAGGIRGGKQHLGSKKCIEVVDLPLVYHPRHLSRMCETSHPACETPICATLSQANVACSSNPQPRSTTLRWHTCLISGGNSGMRVVNPTFTTRGGDTLSNRWCKFYNLPQWARVGGNHNNARLPRYISHRFVISLSPITFLPYSLLIIYHIPKPRWS